MKSLKIFLALMLIVGAAKAQFVKAELQVSGLTCSMCSKATEKSLRTLPFIADVQPDLEHNLFNITFKPNTPVSLEQIGKKVQSAGFSVNQLKTTVDFSKVKVSDASFKTGTETFKLLNAADRSLSGQLAVTVVGKGLASPAIAKKYSAAVGSAGQVYGLLL